MSNIYQFKTTFEIEERGITIAEINELSNQIAYLTTLATESPLAELGMEKRFKTGVVRLSSRRISNFLVKEIAVLKGKRTRLEKSLEN